MTTYSHTIVLDDSELIMMEYAMELMKKHCQEKLESGEGAPFWSYKNSAEDVSRKLYRNTIQTSGNSLFERDKDE